MSWRALGVLCPAGHRHASTGGAAVARNSSGEVGGSNGGGGGGGSGGERGGDHDGAARVSGGHYKPTSAPTTPTPPDHVPPLPASLDPAEVTKFNAQAANWWDPDGGPSAALHALNPLRIAYIRAAAEVFGGAGRREGNAGTATGTTTPPHLGALAAAAAAGASVAATPLPGGDLAGTPAPFPSLSPPPRRPLVGVAALDVGCAGGLVAEPLARLGASVYGIDVSPAGVAAAAAHAVAVDGPTALSAGRLAYHVAGVEALGDGVTFDLVTCMEVVEHVAAPRDFLAALAGRVAPGGVLVLSTLNRTVAAWALGVVAAERVLGWVPPGTHEWGRFVTPEEVVAALAEVAPALDVVDVCGLSYRPLLRRFELSDDVRINYMLTAVRPSRGTHQGVHSRG
ncbi:hypothetical protein MMPV_001956 [Pyropia vietnamensis]